MKNKKIKIIIAAIFIVVGFIGIAFAGIDFGNNKFNINEFVITNVVGLNGKGTIKCELDSEKLLEKISEGEKNAVIILKYKECIDTIKIAIDGDNGKLSNGDRINVKIEYDEELLKDNKIEFENDTFEIKIENLSEGKKIDIFEKIEVIVAGVSPQAYANVKNNWEDEFLSQVKFTLDKTSKIAKGDVITVTCTTKEDEFSDNGYILENNTKEYVVKVANSYIESVDDVEKEAMKDVWEQIQASIDRETTDLSFRILYKATGNEKYLYQYNRENVMSTELDNVYFLKKKDSTVEGAENYFVFVVKAKITNQVENLDVYFAFEYSEASVDDEGKFSLPHSVEEEKYICSSSKEKVYTQMVGARKGSYTVNELSAEIVK